MKRIKIILGLCAIGLDSTAVHANHYPNYKPSTFSQDKEVVLSNWYSKDGIERFSRSQYKQDFYQLAHHFQPQSNPLYCGMATSVIFLNAMRIPKGDAPNQSNLAVTTPKVWGSKVVPFPSYSQATFLNESTNKVKQKSIIELSNITTENTQDASQFDPGVTLVQLKGILEAYDTSVKLNYADMEITKGVNSFRADIQSVLKDDFQFIAVNFVGKKLGTITGGHISPLAAYDKQTDSVLILDVAGHKNPWYWVPVKHLYQAMHTKDGEFYRGWIIVRDLQT